MTLTTSQHATLLAMSKGEPHNLQPMMRRAFLRAGLIQPDGPPPPPSATRHPKRPVRAYLVTAAGHVALKAYAGLPPNPHHEQYSRILFGAAKGAT